MVCILNIVEKEVGLPKHWFFFTYSIVEFQAKSTILLRAFKCCTAFDTIQT